jgi:hypothetical protein
MGDLHQFPGNDMTPPEPDPLDENWWDDEVREPPPEEDDPDVDLCGCGEDHTLPAPTAAEILQADADHWDQIPGVVRGFLAGIQRAERIAEMTEEGSYIHRQALQTVRNKIPVVREWLAQLEEELGTDPEAAESLRSNLVAAGFEEEEVDRHIPMTQEEARRILREYNR